MPDFVTNVGEEWIAENNINGVTVTLTVYNDSTDSLSESDNLAAISTEPSGASFARQSDSVTTLQIGSDFGFDNDSQITFDTSDSSQTVDTRAYIVNFQSDTVAGDGGASDNLVAVASLPQSYDLSSLDELQMAAGDLELTIT